MALNRYVVTSQVVFPAGAFTLDATTGERVGTGSYAQGASTYGSAGGVTIPIGTVIIADPAGALFTAIGAGNLRAYVQGQDDVGHAALSNLGAAVAITAPAVPATNTPVANPTGQPVGATVTGGTVQGVYASNPAAGTITTPAVPASTGTATNSTGQYVAVTVTGGTVTVIAVSGTTIYTATGNTVIVPPGGTVGLTYSVAPTWAWSPVLYGVSGNPIASPQTFPIAPGGSITLLFTVAPTWAWLNAEDLGYTPGYYASSSQAEAAGWNPYTILPMAQHATLGQSNLGTGVSN